MSHPTPTGRPGRMGRMGSRRLLVVAAAVAAVLATAIVLYLELSSSSDGDAGSGPDGAASAGASAAFTARTIAGDSVSVPGSGPSVLFFFSVECGSCASGARALAQAQRTATKATFVAVDIAPNETEDDITSFLTDNHATGLAYISDTGVHLIRAYHVQQLSTAVILDASGRVAFRAVDPTAAQVQAELAKVKTQ